MSQQQRSHQRGGQESPTDHSQPQRHWPSATAHGYQRLQVHGEDTGLKHAGQGGGSNTSLRLRCCPSTLLERNRVGWRDKSRRHPVQVHKGTGPRPRHQQATHEGTGPCQPRLNQPPENASKSPRLPVKHQRQVWRELAWTRRALA